MIKFLCVLLIALTFEAVGVVYLSKGLKNVESMKQVNVSEVIRVVKSAVTNPNVLIGTFFEALFYIGLLYMLSNWDVSLVWPMTALNFVGTAVIAKFFLHEHISPIRWTAIALILVGAMLASYSEKVQEKEKEAAAKPPVRTTTPTTADVAR